MLATVGWVGDGDDDDFFAAIERVFDLKLRAELPWTTFGEVRDHVVRHVAATGGAGTSCATQMAFYRLRRALGLGRGAGPAEPLAQRLAGNLVRHWRNLEADSGLRLPRLRRGSCGIVGAICWVGAAVVLGVAPWPPAARLAAAGPAAYAGLWLRGLDHGRLPRDCASLGDLARITADGNRGRLARHGARLSPSEVWRIIRELAAVEGGHDPAQIGPGTRFFRQR